jgi:hypothetical protein
VQGTIERREGSTSAVRWGAWPVVLVSLFILALARARDTARFAVERIRSRREA